MLLGAPKNMLIPSATGTYYLYFLNVRTACKLYEGISLVYIFHMYNVRQRGGELDKIF